MGWYLLLFYIFILSGCKKFISVDPPATSITEDNVYKDDATAAAVLTGIYTLISKSNSFSGTPQAISAMSYYPGLSADELTLFNFSSNQTLSAYYQNDLKLNNTNATDFWNVFYPAIYTANSAIEGISNTTTLNPLVKKQLLGEAYFIRAFCYFYLINLYGDVPLVTSTKYSETINIARTPKAEVNQQIISDLVNAGSMLSTNYLDGSVTRNTMERVRPNQYAAHALLARVYLFGGDFSNAEIEATKVIENSALYDTVSLASVFIKNSKETIWAIQPVSGTTAQNTGDGRLFILPASGPSAIYPVYLSSQLMSSFENGDGRLQKWTGNVTVGTNNYPFAYKYKIGAVNTPTVEYLMVLRLSEQYLIRGEARARLQNWPGANNDLNVIRIRAGLPVVSIDDEALLTDTILHERQVELFTEWGHRWLDLKRTGKVDGVMSVVTPIKGGTWDDRWVLYPVPQTELDRNPALLPNPGYEN